MITVYKCYYRENLRSPVLKSFQAIINLVFEFYNTIESPLRILYFTPNFTDMLLYMKIHIIYRYNVVSESGNIYALSARHCRPHSSSIKKTILNWHDRLFGVAVLLILHIATTSILS